MDSPAQDSRRTKTGSCRTKRWTSVLTLGLLTLPVVGGFSAPQSAPRLDSLALRIADSLASGNEGDNQNIRELADMLVRQGTKPAPSNALCFLGMPGPTSRPALPAKSEREVDDLLTYMRGGNERICLSPDAKLAVWWRRGGDAYLIMTSGREKRISRDSHVQDCVFSPNSEKLIVLGRAELRMFAAATGAATAQLPLANQPSSVIHAQFTQYDGQLFLQYSDGPAIVWTHATSDPGFPRPLRGRDQVNSQTFRWIVNSPAYFLRDPHFTSRDQFVATDLSGTLREFDFGGSDPNEPMYPSMPVTADFTAYCPPVVGTQSGHVCAYDLLSNKAKLIADIKAHTAPVAKVIADERRNYVASLATDGSIFLTRMESNGAPTVTPIARTHVDLAGKVDDILISPSGKWLVADGKKSAVAIDHKGDSSVVINEEHVYAISDVWIPNSYETRVLAGDDGTLRLMTIPDRKLLWSVTLGGRKLSRAVLANEANYVAAVTEKRTVYLWNVETSHEHIVATTEADIECFAFSPQGRFLLVLDKNGSGGVYSTKTGQLASAFPKRASFSQPRKLCLTPDGRHLLIVCSNAPTAVWNLDSNTKEFILENISGGLKEISFSADSRLVLGIAHDDRARLWEVATGKLLRVFSLPYDEAESAALSPSGRLVAISGETLELYDLKEPARNTRVPKSVEMVSLFQMRFSLDEKSLILAGRGDGGGGPIEIWKLDPLGLEKRFNAHEEGVVDLALSSNGRYLLSASDDETACLWDLKRLELVAKLLGHPDILQGAMFSPDSGLAITYSRGGFACVHAAGPASFLRQASEVLKKQNPLRYDAVRSAIEKGLRGASTWDRIVGREP